MFRRPFSAKFLSVVTLPLATSGVAWCAEPTTTDMAEQIRALREEVAELRAASQPATTKSIAVRDEVLLDAQRRSHLLHIDTAVEPSTAGVEKGKFFIRDTAGNFSISPVFQLQIRTVSNWSDSADDESFDNGFEIRRAKFGAEGHAFSKDLGYKFVWATNRSGGSVFLEDALISYQLSPEWKVFGGQFKDPVHHEELVSSTRQLAVDRSIVNEVLGGGATDRIQGVGVAYQRGALAAQAVFHDGINSDNTNFLDSPTNATDFGFSGRLEYTVFGDRKAYNDFTARKNKSDLLVLGLGGSATGGAEQNLYFYTIDTQWENTRGTGVYAALLGLTSDGHASDASSETDWGGLLQVAQMIVGDRWETFGRVGFLDGEGDDLWELTVGLNYYLFDHNAKLTTDVVYLPAGSPSDSGLSYVASDGAQVVWRVQFQLAL